MEKLGKDLIGVIFEKMTPTDWYCTSLVCKKWWLSISKWLRIRKTQFIKHLKNNVDLFALNIKASKDKFCIAPMYHLQEAGTGCKGQIKNYICARHKFLSIYNRDICDVCKKNPSSANCFGNRCSSIICRDYTYILKNGKAEKVRAYPCNIQDCLKFTDVKGGMCFGHAVSAVYKEDNIESRTYRCSAQTQSKNRCSLKTTSRIGKCHHHSFSPISLAE